MGEAFVVRFRTVILPPLKCLDRVALRRQLFQPVLDLFHLFGRRAVFEFQEQPVLQFTVLARLLRLPPIVDDKHLVQMRPQRSRERLMVGMRQILRAARLIREREQEAVREAVVETIAC